MLVSIPFHSMHNVLFPLRGRAVAQATKFPPLTTRHDCITSIDKFVVCMVVSVQQFMCVFVCQKVAGSLYFNSFSSSAQSPSSSSTTYLSVPYSLSPSLYLARNMSLAIVVLYDGSNEYKDEKRSNLNRSSNRNAFIAQQCIETAPRFALASVFSIAITSSNMYQLPNQNMSLMLISKYCMR